MKLPVLKIGELCAKVPIVQGGMAIRLSLSRLAGTVARAGGIGLIAATGLTMEELREEIRKARQIAPNGIVGINIMVAASSFKESVWTAINEKIDLVVAGAGFSRDIFDWGKASRTPIVPIVSTAKLARIAERLGASAVVVEGAEAGGHLGTSHSVKEILPEVRAAVSLPVIGAGGVVNGRDMAEMLELGADGVQIGSRFTATDESAASPAMKEAYVRCSRPEDIIVIQSSVGLPGQAIRNPFSEAVLNDTVERPKVCTNCLKKCTRRFCLSQALIRAQQGDGVTGLIFAGTNMLRIHSILPAEKVIRDICQEAALCLAGRQRVDEVSGFHQWTGRWRSISAGRLQQYRQALATCTGKMQEDFCKALHSTGEEAVQILRTKINEVKETPMSQAAGEVCDLVKKRVDEQIQGLHGLTEKIRTYSPEFSPRISRTACEKWKNWKRFNSNGRGKYCFSGQ